MEIDKTKLKNAAQQAVGLGMNLAQAGASAAATAVPIVGSLAAGGINLLSNLAKEAINNYNNNNGSGGDNAAAYNTPYTQSEQVTQLGNQLEALQAPVQQPSQYAAQLQQTMDAILNQKEFTYDVNADALYNQYKDQYILGGKMAMQDAMGQAAALTGGYGNSYAQAVGQQQYQGYLQQLNNKIPELYQLARDSYDRDTQNMYQKFGLLSDAEAKEYSRYRDQMADFYNNRDYLTDRYYNERNIDYGMWKDNRDFAYGQHRDNVADEQWQKTFDRNVYESDRNHYYQMGRDVVADMQWQQAYARDVYESDRNYNYNVGRDAVEDARYNAQWQNTLDRQAIEDARWQQEFNIASDKASGGSGGGSGGDSSNAPVGSDDPNLTYVNVCAYAREVYNSTGTEAPLYPPFYPMTEWQFNKDNGKVGNLTFETYEDYLAFTVNEIETMVWD